MKKKPPRPPAPTPGKLFPDKDVVSIKPLHETGVTEGHTASLPFFKLSRKDAHPHRGKNADGTVNRVNEDYTEEYHLGPGATLIIKANPHYGYPTVFAMRVLLVIEDRCRHLGYISRKVPITLQEIAHGLGIKRPGGKNLKAIKNALYAMAGGHFLALETWQDPDTKTKLDTTGWDQLITGFQLGSDSSGAAVGDLTNYVELGERFYESLRKGNRVGVDLKYIAELPNDTAQRLYIYLTKNNGDIVSDGEKTPRLSYTEGIMKFATKVAITSTRPAKIRATLTRGLAPLARPTKSGKQFLSSFTFEGNERDARVTVCFNTAGWSRALVGRRPTPPSP